MKFILIVIFFIKSVSVYGQNKIDLTYFTLGLVKDYLGRDLIKEDRLDRTKVDTFHETEINSIIFLDSLISIENSFRERNNRIDKRIVRGKKKDCSNCNEFFVYYSKALAGDVNKKYHFRFSKSWDMHERKIYYGLIKRTAIRADNQRISFLIGAYLRFGTREENIYKIKQANSYSKHKQVLRSLKKLNCEILSKNEIKSSIPGSQTIEFIPTESLKDSLDKLEPLKMKVDLKRAEELTN